MFAELTDYRGRRFLVNAEHVLLVMPFEASEQQRNAGMGDGRAVLILRTPTIAQEFMVTDEGDVLPAPSGIRPMDFRQVVTETYEIVAQRLWLASTREGMVRAPSRGSLGLTS